MKKRSRLIFTLASLALAITVMAFGVYAASSASLSISSSVTYVCEDVFINVKTEYFLLASSTTSVDTGSATDTFYGVTYTGSGTRMSPLDGVKTASSSYVSSGDAYAPTAQDETFTASNKCVVVRITLQNVNANNSASVSVSALPTAIENTTYTLTYGSDSTDIAGTNEDIEAGTALEIPASSTRYIVYRRNLTDSSKSVGTSVTGWNPSITLSDGYFVDNAPLLQWDSTGSYWYLTMGDLNGTPIKWKMISTATTETTSNPTSTRPSALTGIYIMESWDENEFRDQLKEVCFDKTNESTDYSASEIRKYINGTSGTAYHYNGSSRVSIDTSSVNLASDLHIDTTGSVYQAIQPVSFSGETKSTTNGTDKFWLLSYNEATNLLCGGSWDSSKANWNADSESDYFWLRSAYDSTFVNYVGSDGSYDYNLPDVCSAVRAAFQIA